MYTVKVSGTGAIFFQERDVRLPATFKKITDKKLKLLKALCRAHNLTYEILEEESERLASVVGKIHEDVELPNIDAAIDGTETSIEDLFEGDDTLGNLLGKD